MAYDTRDLHMGMGIYHLSDVDGGGKAKGFFSVSFYS